MTDEPTSNNPPTDQGAPMARALGPPLRRRRAAAVGSLLMPSASTLLLGAASDDWLPAVIVTGAVFTLTVMVLAFVVWPAVWARDKKRRRAALAVLDRLLGRPTR